MQQYVVDTFTDKVFSGNPAAVVVTKRWPSDELMQNIAMENGLSATAFVAKEGDGYRLRWFTPSKELDLCGHGTLAASYVIFSFYAPELETLTFRTKGGPLTVEKNGEILTMTFPTFRLRPISVSEELHAALGGVWAQEAYQGVDIVCVVESEDQLRNLKPDPEVIANLTSVMHVTAPGDTYDCVTRTFAPAVGVLEDSVSGRAHCHVVPLWAEKIGKNEITAAQASPRGGMVYCDYGRGKVLISGRAVLFSEGTLHL